MTLVGDDSFIGEDQPAALAPADHRLNGVAEKTTCTGSIAQFAGPFQIFPGDLE